MDGLVKLLEANGITFKAGLDHKTAPMSLQVDGELIQVSLKEDVRGRKRELTASERRDHERFPSVYYKDFARVYDPTNRFVFEIDNFSDGQRRWADTKHRKIEDFTEQIVHGVRAAAAYEERRCAVRKAEHEREVEEQRRRFKQQDRVERLKNNLARWEEAQRIRMYLAAVQKAADPEDSPKLLFLAWAHRYADSLDPTGAPAAGDWAENLDDS
jgi:hypothetical protein